MPGLWTLDSRLWTLDSEQMTKLWLRSNFLILLSIERGHLMNYTHQVASAQEDLWHIHIVKK